MNIYNEHSKILTIGLTTHLNADQSKLQLMLASLCSTTTIPESYRTKEIAQETRNVLINALEQNNLEYITPNESVELLINIDIYVKESPKFEQIDTIPVPASTDRTIMLTDSVNKTLSKNSFKPSDVLTPLQLKRLDEIVKIIQSTLSVPILSQTKICFTINNINTIRVSTARNNIIRNARGKYITFRDDDDMTVNINEHLTFIAASEYFKNENMLTVRSATDLFKRYREDTTLLNIQLLHDSSIIYIETACTKDKPVRKNKPDRQASSNLPKYSQMNTITPIVQTDFLLKHNLYFSHDIEAEDTTWRFQMYRVLYDSHFKPNQIKIIPLSAYFIYESSRSNRKRFNDSKWISAIRRNYLSVFEKYFHKVPFMINHLQIVMLLGSGMIEPKYFLQHMFFERNYEYYTYGKYFAEIARYNADRLTKLRAQHLNPKVFHVEIPHEIEDAFIDEFKYDQFSMNIYPIFRGRNELPLCAEDVSYPAVNMISHLNDSVEQLRDIKYSNDQTYYDKYLSDFDEILTVDEIDRDTYLYYCTPTLLLKLIRMVKLSDIEYMLDKFWSNKDPVQTKHALTGGGNIARASIIEYFILILTLIVIVIIFLKRTTLTRTFQNNVYKSKYFFI